MVLKITKVAELVGSEIVASIKPGVRFNQFASLLTEFETIDPDGPQWHLSISIGEGSNKRNVMIALANFVTVDQFQKSHSVPITFTTEPSLVLFRNRFFLTERKIRTSSEQEEVVLRAKKVVFDEEGEITSLKSFVSNIDAAVEYQKTGIKRESISDDVKLLVWSRDSGVCARCGSAEKIHFDHILPVAKGGSNTSENIQLLCQSCNLRKSDKIAF